MLILELLHISCEAPEGHRHRDGQQTAEREDGVRDEGEKVVGQERRRRQVAKRDGGRAEWWV